MSISKVNMTIVLNSARLNFQNLSTIPNLDEKMAVNAQSSK